MRNILVILAAIAATGILRAEEADGAKDANSGNGPKAAQQPLGNDWRIPGDVLRRREKLSFRSKIAGQDGTPLLRRTHEDRRRTEGGIF